MKDLIGPLQRLIREITGDLSSCRNRFLFFENKASRKDLIIFTLLAITILGVIILNSSSQVSFYINFLKLLAILLMSFFVYTQSDCFWFLIAKGYLYNYNIKHRRHMKIFMDRANEVSFDETGNIQEYMLLTAFSNSHGYKRHATRYLIEVCLMLFAFLYIMPDFFLYNLVVFIIMFVYVFSYEREASSQVFSDIIILINCIRELIKEDPKECKTFILKNNNQEIKDLKKLYKFVLESDRK